MVVGYFGFGGQLMASGENQVLAASSLGYAASGLLGYFGMCQMPLVAFARTNFMSVIMAIMGVAGMVSGGYSLPLLALTVMHCFDVL